jgi:hypothetical protein
MKDEKRDCDNTYLAPGEYTGGLDAVLYRAKE